MAKPVQFVHLRARTPYSILEGATKIDAMAKRAKEYRMPAIAMTDTHNMCGALEFSGTMVSSGLQPIIGVTLSVDLEFNEADNAVFNAVFTQGPASPVAGTSGWMLDEAHMSGAQLYSPVSSMELPYSPSDSPLNVSIMLSFIFKFIHKFIHVLLL